MMRDLFERFRVPSKIGATRVTGATSALKPNISQGFRSTPSVAHGGQGIGDLGNTGRNAGVAAAPNSTDVALLPKPGKVRATPDADEELGRDNDFSQPLHLLPVLPSEGGTVDTAALAYAILAESFEHIATFWIEGAALPSAELEAEIDHAVLAGDLGALKAALSIYVQAARERCAASRKCRHT